MLATWLRLLPTTFAIVLACARIRRPALIAARLFHRVEVFALNVLDDHDLQRVVVADLHRHDRHIVQAGALRRAPAPFAGDDLEIVRRAGTVAPRSAGSRRADGSIRRARRARSRRKSCADCADWVSEIRSAHGAARARAPPSPIRRRRRRSDLQVPCPVAIALPPPSPPPSNSHAAPTQFISVRMISSEITGCARDHRVSLRAARARAGSLRSRA